MPLSDSTQRLDPSIRSVPGDQRWPQSTTPAAWTSTGPQVVVFSDTRNGLPGGPDEATGGDAAAAILFSEKPAAVCEGRASRTAEVMANWRLANSSNASSWEPRFQEYAYALIAEEAAAEALKMANLTGSQVDHFVSSGSPPRLFKGLRNALSISDRAEGLLRTGGIGDTGTADMALGLIEALERAKPGEVILCLSVADGADALVFRTTDRLPEAQAATRQTLSARLSAPPVELDYSKFLEWNGRLQPQPPRRPLPVAPTAPPSLRNEGWKFALIGSKCMVCGAVHLPPARRCRHCRSLDQMEPCPMADRVGLLFTHTVDYLSPGPGGPTVMGLVDFPEGGRFRCELTDVVPAELHRGLPMRMTFRCFYTAGDTKNYFWKAAPVRPMDEP